MKKINLYFLLLTFLILPFSMIAAQEGQDDTYIILYDESHDQFFTTDLMNTSLDSLSTAFGKTIILQKNTETFTPTSLQGADLLIITNPGQDAESADEDEKLALETYVTSGGSILYMTNPFSFNANVSGNAKPLNDLLIDNFDGRIKTDGLDSENTSIIIDDFNYKINDSNVLVNAKNLAAEFMREEIVDITEGDILLHSALISSSDTRAEYYANTSQYAYAVTQDYKRMIDSLRETPLWMYGDEFSSGGRVMLVGSTVMFSDYSYDGTETWVDQENNLGVFQNFVAWLLNITPVEEENELINQTFSFFAWYNFLIALGIGLVFLVAWIGYLLFTGKITKDRIFDVKIPKKSEQITKKKKSKKGKSKKKGSKK
ncbi:MAG: hypothetical protein INQ03_15140 [Candidatus Heimdallarchaeota archaeon]|nr:hypothetical protein [Candidatus Heimdallarchaeota archaeon]